jgi:hypothetical protein
MSEGAAIDDCMMNAETNFVRLELALPPRTRALLAAAFRAARNDAGTWLSNGECLTKIAKHFIAVWGPVQKALRSPRRTVVGDRRFCQTPGCNRAATHAHRLVYVSRSESDAPCNTVSMCASHLCGLHRRLLGIRAEPPDGLYWWFGRAPPPAAAVAKDPKPPLPERKEPPVREPRRKEPPRREPERKDPERRGPPQGDPPKTPQQPPPTAA